MFSRSVGHFGIRTTMGIYAYLDMTQNWSVQRSIDDLEQRLNKAEKHTRSVSEPDQ